MNGYDRGSSYNLQQACDGTTSSHYYSYQNYGVNNNNRRGDFIDFIFTFADANTWCSGYRQTGTYHSYNTNQIEIFTSNQNFGPWTSVATDTHDNWYTSGNSLAHSGITTEWTPTGPSKYLKVRTYSNHGDTHNGGRLLVRYLQLKFSAVGTAETTGMGVEAPRRW